MRRLTWWAAVVLLLAACGPSPNNEAAIATAVQLTLTAHATPTVAPVVTRETVLVPQTVEKPVPVTVLVPQTVVPPTAPAAAPTSQDLVSLTSPIRHGDYATIIVRTKPGASCSIAVYYKSGRSKAQGLGPMNAGNDGLCFWTWRVGTNTTPGTWRIIVTSGSTTKTYPFVVQ